MSYDVTVVDGPTCDHCGREGQQVLYVNYTSNMSGAWCEAGIMLHEWDDARVVDILPTLRMGIAVIEANPAAFKQFEPDNGWGSVETMLVFLRQILDACEANPSGFLKVSR